MNRYEAESIDIDLAAQDAERETPEALKRRIRKLSDRVAALSKDNDELRQQLSAAMERAGAYRHERDEARRELSLKEE
jgi:uncharacterized coiled-coil DUF342 family protein